MEKSNKSNTLFLQKQEGSDTPESLFLLCPICNKSVLRSVIETHVELCLANSQNTSSNQCVDNSGIESKEISVDEERGARTSKKRPYLDKEADDTRKPLAERVRPTTFDYFEGNEDIFGNNAVLRSIVSKDPPPSMILFGPPGCGKTTIATIIKSNTKCAFHGLSCCTAGVDDIKRIVENAEKTYRATKQCTILFMDEIHRFNKKQQDFFLPFVERGLLVLIGATTENPSFSINEALLSRCQVIPMKLLSVEALMSILRNAMEQDAICKRSGMIVSDAVLKRVAEDADGDARLALNTLEMCCKFISAAPNKELSEEIVTKLKQNRFVRYDKKGEEHYNIISALHKSMRGSDVQAALYWLGRMIEGGEDPTYIARRLIRCATEDIGLSDPQALLYAIQCYEMCNEIGYPQCVTQLSQCVVYLTMTSKSNELYIAYGRVKELIREDQEGNASAPDISVLGEQEMYQNRDCLPKRYQDKQFVDIHRAVSDLRELSIESYLKK